MSGQVDVAKSGLMKVVDVRKVDRRYDVRAMGACFVEGFGNVTARIKFSTAIGDPQPQIGDDVGWTLYGPAASSDGGEQ